MPSNASPPDALRLFFLRSHYRSPVEYRDENVQAQGRAVDRLRNALRPGDGSGPALDPARYSQRFVEAMDDDINTPRALAALFDLARDINRDREAGCDVAQAQDTLRELAGVLGLSLAGSGARAADSAGPFIDILVEVRSELRAARQYEMADRIRSRLEERGIVLEDKPDGTVWRVEGG